MFKTTIRNNHGIWRGRNNSNTTWR